MFAFAPHSFNAFANNRLKHLAEHSKKFPVACSRRQSKNLLFVAQPAGTLLNAGVCCWRWVCRFLSMRWLYYLHISGSGAEVMRMP